MTYGLILFNFIVFLGELAWTEGFDPCLTSQLFYSYGFVPYSLVHGAQLSFDCSTGNVLLVGYSPAAYFTLLSSMFLHAGWLHIIGNMLFLFVFGPNMEAKFGRVKYLAMYLGAGLAGAAATTLAASMTGSPDLFVPAVGASGAISGVLGAYLVVMPRSRIISIIGYFVIPVSAFWFIGGWFLLQVFYQLGGIDTGVAYLAHIGGFTLGALLGLLVREARPAQSEFEL